MTTKQALRSLDNKAAALRQMRADLRIPPHNFNTYAEAIANAHKIGGRKYHTKAFGGGLIFQGTPEEVEYHARRFNLLRPTYM